MATSWEAEFKPVDDLIADAEQRIERQRALTRKLAAAGLGDAERTLALMMTILEVCRKIRIALECQEPGRTRH